MDLSIARIVREGGFNFKGQFDGSDTDEDQRLYRFIPEGTPSFTDEQLSKWAKAIRAGLDKAGVKYVTALFQKQERGKGPNYYIFTIRIARTFEERPSDRDIHGNLIWLHRPITNGLSPNPPLQRRNRIQK